MGCALALRIARARAPVASGQKHKAASSNPRFPVSTQPGTRRGLGVAPLYVLTRAFETHHFEPATPPVTRSAQSTEAIPQAQQGRHFCPLKLISLQRIPRLPAVRVWSCMGVLVRWCACGHCPDGLASPCLHVCSGVNSAQFSHNPRAESDRTV